MNGRRLRRWGPVVLLLALETWVSSQSALPGFSTGLDLPHGDKLGHLGFFFLTGLAAVAAGRGEGWTRRRQAAILIPAAFVYGVLDEWHQSFVPGRDVEAADVAADVAGVALAVGLGERLSRSGPRVDRR